MATVLQKKRHIFMVRKLGCHGMVLPQLNHGGPGRAGGGAELGALRGLELYMQRSAIQGNKALFERLLS